MQLLLSRDQVSSTAFSLVPLRIGSGTTFTLLAELELTAEEETLLKKYNFAKAPLVVSDPIDDLKQSFRPALMLGVVAFIVFWVLTSFTAAFGLAMLVTLVMTIVYFRSLREQIIVRELLDGGRKFRCESIVDLIKKEVFLRHICAYLRQVLESAKNWGDREAIPIEPLSKTDAMQAVLKASS